MDRSEAAVAGETAIEGDQGELAADGEGSEIGVGNHFGLRARRARELTEKNFRPGGFRGKADPTIASQLFEEGPSFLE